jgi:hypothetical protein
MKEKIALFLVFIASKISPENFADYNWINWAIKKRIKSENNKGL